MGEVGELSRRLPLLLDAAEERGDRYSAAVLRTGWNVLPGLAADDPVSTRREVNEAVARWQAGGFHVQHCLALHSNVQLALYEGHAEEARRLLERRWGAMRELAPARAASAAARHVVAADALRARLRRAAARRWPACEWLRERYARRILRHDRAWSTPLAQLGLAGLAFLRGRSADAARALAEAQRGFDSADMGLFSAAAQRVRGQLVGGDEGRAAVAAADRHLAAQGVRNPARLTRLLAPGFTRAG